jgi:hypothetical protein
MKQKTIRNQIRMTREQWLAQQPTELQMILRGNALTNFQLRCARYLYRKRGYGYGPAKRFVELSVCYNIESTLLWCRRTKRNGREQVRLMKKSGKVRSGARKGIKTK